MSGFLIRALRINGKVYLGRHATSPSPDPGPAWWSTLIRQYPAENKVEVWNLHRLDRVTEAVLNLHVRHDDVLAQGYIGFDPVRHPDPLNFVIPMTVEMFTG